MELNFETETWDSSISILRLRIKSHDSEADIDEISWNGDEWSLTHPPVKGVCTREIHSLVGDEYHLPEDEFGDLSQIQGIL